MKLAYLSSRTYGGWAKPRPDGREPGNSEPYSYESGFAVKWLIERQFAGDPALNFDRGQGTEQGPLAELGRLSVDQRPDAAQRRRCSSTLDDFQERDRMHESPAGQEKAVRHATAFFQDGFDDETVVCAVSPR